MQTNKSIRPIRGSRQNPADSRFVSMAVDPDTCAVCFQKSNCLAGIVDHEDIRKQKQANDPNKVISKLKFLPGEYLFRLSEPFEALYMVLSGSAKSCCSDANGDEQIVGLHIPGDLIGLDAISSGVYMSSGVALDECFVCRLPYSFFDERFSVAQRLKLKLVRQAAQALRTEHFHSLYIRNKKAEERLAMFLIDLSRRLESRYYAADRIALSLSRRDIGNYLGISLETVSRSFSRLQDAGLISVQQRQVIIHDREKLERMAKGSQPAEKQSPEKAST